MKRLRTKNNFLINLLGLLFLKKFSFNRVVFIFLLGGSLFLTSLLDAQDAKAPQVATGEEAKEEVKKEEVKKLTYAQREEKASELLESSKQAEQLGRYDEAITFANESSRISKEIEEYKNIKKRHNWLWFRMAVAKHLAVEKKDPKSYNKAYGIAVESIGLIETEETLPKAKKIIEEGIVLIDRAIEGARKSVKGKGNIVVSQKKDGTYEVRYLPGKRDCLWRISSYDFVYNDALKWKLIYKANKTNIKDPDLIFPGQILIIPDLEGAVSAKNIPSSSAAAKQVSPQKSQTNQKDPIKNK